MKLNGKLDTDSFLGSSEDTEEEMLRISLYGATGCGKTIAAATVSEQFKFGKCTLDDTCWLPFDMGALRGFSQWGVVCPNTIRFHDIYAATDKDLVKTLSICKELYQKAIDKGVKNFVIDTASMLNKYILMYWSDPKRHPVSEKSKQPDTRKYYKCVLDTHMAFFQNFLMEPSINVVFLSHLRANVAESSDQENRLKALTPGGAFDVYPDITGQALGLYNWNMDILAYLDTSEVKAAGKTTVKRVLYPLGGPGAGKNRWQEALGTTEEPNLQNILQKIRKGKQNHV